MAKSHEISLPVLGVSTRFVSDDPGLLEMVGRAYGWWGEQLRVEDPGVVSPSTATVRLTLFERDDAGGDTGLVHHLLDRDRLVLFGELGVGLADAVRLESIGHVARRLTDDWRAFTDGFLDPLTLFLVGALDRQPLHAAAVVRNAVAVLLAAPSGTGKTTLAYAASRKGFEVLADEPVYIQSHRALRLWGRGPRLNLPLDARTRFSELADAEPIELPSGKTKVVVEGVAPARPYADAAGICLLRRGAPSAPGLERIASGEVVAELTTDLDPGFDLFADTIGERIAAVAERGAWRLDLSDDPDEGVALLEEVVAELEGGF